MTVIKNGPKTKKLKVKAISNLLSTIYGPIPWEPRYNASEELVYTILSQHTSDINSERAFHNLLTVFGDLNHIADASVDDIVVAIRRGWLSKTKAPRIKSILNEIREELGAFDLSFLADMPLKDAKAWLINL